MIDLAALTALKAELNARRPLTRGELERLRDFLGLSARRQRPAVLHLLRAWITLPLRRS